jgi:hypothetical protein
VSGDLGLEFMYEFSTVPSAASIPMRSDSAKPFKTRDSPLTTRFVG